MDWLRSTIGITPAPQQQRKPNNVIERHRKEAETKSYDDRADALLRKQAIQLQMMEMELAETEEDCQKAVKDRNIPEAKRLLTRKQQLTKDISVLRAKNNNLSKTGSQIAVANQNLAQALLVKDGADELEDAVAAMEEIDLDDAMDRLQDNAGMIQEHDDRLSEPIFGEPVEFEVDEELERLMRERDDAEASKHSLPSVYEGVQTSQGTKPHQVAAVEKDLRE